MKFITYNDAPGGVYKSQVIDVCRFLQTTFNIEVELVAFVSFRTYYAGRKKINKLYENATVLPSFPGITNWRKNLITLRFFMLFRKKDIAISRGVFATLLALDSGKFSKVCFDARTAYAAEWKEYLSNESEGIAAAINNLEKEALSRSDFRISVSEKLVSYWKEKFGYNKDAHVVIPCTIDSSLEQSTLPTVISELRKEMKFNETGIILVFSGSNAGWQSMKDLYQILKPAFIENSSLKLLLLTEEKGENEFSKLYAGRVITKWVEQKKVPYYLSVADYGLLYRENSVTNTVSSPVKFAEYLAAGLPVIISNNVGDYSSFVKEKNCGLLFDSVNWKDIKRPSVGEKERMRQVAMTNLTKSAFKEEYRRVVEM